MAAISTSWLLLVISAVLLVTDAVTCPASGDTSDPEEYTGCDE
jgi:hypothetical protein